MPPMAGLQLMAPNFAEPLLLQAGHAFEQARGLAGLRELNAAVKTGTAETRDKTINHTWIGGFLPFSAPRYAFAVVIHSVPGHGAEIAGPVAESVMRAVVRQGAK